jgi:glycosyltransferase involved in cell wall biosynthesis
VTRVLEELVPRLLALDPERYVVVATTAARDRLSAVPAARLRIVPRCPQSLWEQFALPLLARRERADAIYCHRECAPLWGPLTLLHVTEDPEVRWDHTAATSTRERARRLYSRLLMDRSLRRARVVASTASSRDDLVGRHGLRADEIAVVPLGVDMQRFAANNRRVVEGDRYFFCLGSDDPRDGCELVVESFGRFSKQSGAGTRLVVAGELGARRAQLTDLAYARNVAALVDMPGRVSDAVLATHYRKCLATVCVSNHEGFGLQPLEAMAGGSLLIAARTPAVQEVARGAVVLWTQFDDAELAEAMARAADSADLRLDASSENPRIAASFDWALTARAIDGLLTSLAFESRNQS